MGWRDALSEDATIDLVLRALYEAADEDSATGGPDLLRGIFPVVATITSSGFERLADADLETRYLNILDQVATERGGSR
jgi:proteasome beta subunit